MTTIIVISRNDENPDDIANKYALQENETENLDREIQPLPHITLPYYKWPKCYQNKLEKTGEEAEFSNPFYLKDGYVAYRARFDEIDWERMHGFNKDIYKAAWELCVEDRDPEDNTEFTIKKNMMNRTEYFKNFSSKERYITYSTSFFAYGIATSERFIHLKDDEDMFEFANTFYDKYIKDLNDDDILSIYEVHKL